MVIGQDENSYGGRMLKQWMDTLPLIQKERIEERLEWIETFVNDYFFTWIDLEGKVKKVYMIVRPA